jgi:hypothetical protein
VPSEAELQFFGDNNQTAVALVRLDNQDILANGQTAICTSTDPFVTWECGRRIEERLDGPTWIVEGQGSQARSFVFARKHLPCTRKRTAIYELRGDLADPNAAIEVCEIQEVDSAGDTAYTSLGPGTAAPSTRTRRGWRGSSRRATSGSRMSTSPAHLLPASTRNRSAPASHHPCPRIRRAPTSPARIC